MELEQLKPQQAVALHIPFSEVADFFYSGYTLFKFFYYLCS